MVLATHAYFFWSVRQQVARGDPDFTVFYTAGKVLRQGRGADLYNPRVQQEVQRTFTANAEVRRGPLPYIHPPFEALIFVPLTFFSYPLAFVLWSLVNMGLLVGIGALLRRQVPSLTRVPSWILLACLLAFFPIFANFHQGQDAILLLLLLLLGYRALAAGADFKAGCWLGFAIFKYHLMLPLALILMIWRGRKLAGGFLASASCMTAISVVLVGWHGIMQYPALAWAVVTQPAYGGIPYRQMPNLVGLVGGWSAADHLGSWVQWVALIADLVLLLLTFLLRPAARTSEKFPLCFGCAVIAALLIGHSTNTYDLCWLVLPTVLAIDYGVREFRLRHKRHFSILVPAIPLLISPLWFILWMRWERIHVMAIFLVWWWLAIRSEALASVAPSPIQVSA